MCREERVSVYGATIGDVLPDRQPDLEVTGRPSIMLSPLIHVLLHWAEDGQPAEVVEHTQVVEDDGVRASVVEVRMRVWIVQAVSTPTPLQRLDAMAQALRELRRLVRRQPHAVPMPELRAWLRQAGKLVSWPAPARGEPKEGAAP